LSGLQPIPRKNKQPAQRYNRIFGDGENMKTEKYLINEIADLESFLNLVEAYEEISALRMRKVKKSVLSRREFLEGLNEAFSYIIYSYSEYRKALKKKTRLNILQTNGRNLLILLSSNTGLYGDIVKRVFNDFISAISSSNDKTDILITGKMGKQLYDNTRIKTPYKYFEISDTATNDENVKTVLEYINNYESISVFHGVFNSILSQETHRTFLTGEIIRMESKGGTYSKSFLFEPSIERVAEYFEKQILALIFEQSVFESSLSKFASRMVSLDAAASNINEKVKVLDFDLQKAQHRKTNANIQENISGSSLWLQ